MRFSPSAISMARQLPSSTSTPCEPKPKRKRQRTMPFVSFVLICIVLLVVVVKDSTAINDGSPAETSLLTVLQRFNQHRDATTAISGPRTEEEEAEGHERNRRSNQDVTVGRDLLMMQTDGGVGAGSGEISSQVGEKKM